MAQGTSQFIVVESPDKPTGNRIRESTIRLIYTCCKEIYKLKRIIERSALSSFGGYHNSRNQYLCENCSR